MLNLNGYIPPRYSVIHVHVHTSEGVDLGSVDVHVTNRWDGAVGWTYEEKSLEAARELFPDEPMRWRGAWAVDRVSRKNYDHKSVVILTEAV